MRTAHLFRNGEWIAGPLDVAESFFERSRGLLGRDRIEGRAGMLIEWCGAIHTCFMRFAIDVVFLAKDGTVRKVRHGVKPYRIAMAPFSRWTVELGAGVARETGLEPGQVLELRAEGPGTRTGDQEGR
ncbi:MAG: DUF192 domain-containing protein [Planctomycetota bacterium]